MLNVLPMEATYLCWIDCRELGLTDGRLQELILEDARIYVDDGLIFGPEGSGFFRLNLACPKKNRRGSTQPVKKFYRSIE